MVVKNKKGQAIFELLVFIPILIFFYLLFLRIGNSINSSINLQKATRRYFLHTMKGSSMVPGNFNLSRWKGDGISLAGMISFGFRENEGANADSEQSFAPCYRMPSLLGIGNEDEECENPEVDENTTSFIRVYSFYGICGETYFDNGSYYSSYMTQVFANQMNSAGVCYTVR